MYILERCKGCNGEGRIPMPGWVMVCESCEGQGLIFVNRMAIIGGKPV